MKQIANVVAGSPSSEAESADRTARGWYRHLLLALLLAGSLLALGLFTMAQLVYAAAGDITGTVTYYGRRPGTIGIQLSVFTTTVPPAPPPVATDATSTDVGDYTIAGVEEGTYYVFTYLDIDGDSNYDPAQEPYAWYDYEGDGRADSVTVIPGGTTRGIDILLTDLWQPLGGPFGQVNAIAAQPGISGTLYAAVGTPFRGTEATLYKTVDGAATWTAVYTHTGQELAALAVTDTLVYAGGVSTAGLGQIIRSMNGGTDWVEVFAGPGQQAGAVRDIAISPVTTATAYAVGYGRGASTGYTNNGFVYRTTNGGVDWTTALTVAESDLLAVTVSPLTPTLVFAGGYYRMGTDQYAALFRSVDSGDTWAEVLTTTYGTEQQFTDIVVHPTTPTLVYAGTQNNKAVYRSLDAGLNWTRVYTDRGFRLALDPPSTVFASDDWRELAVSAADGDPGSWDGRVSGELTPDVMQAMAIDNAEPDAVGIAVLYLGFRERGIGRSTDGGLTWELRNDGIAAATAPQHIEIDPQNQALLYVATGCAGGWRTGDNGETWDRLLDDCVTQFAVHPQNSAVLYAGITGNATKAIARSSDGATTFESVYTGTTDIMALAIAPSGANLVLAGGEDSATGAATLVRSTDGGGNWTEVFSLPDGTVTALAIHPADAAIALAGVTDRSGGSDVAEIYRTDDGGDTWVLVYGTGAGAIHSIVIDEKLPSNVYATDDFSVLKSDDGGVTWLTPLLSYGQANHNLLAMDPRLADHVYLVGPGYIAETLDGGTNWSDWPAPINQGTEGRTATALAVSQGGITQTLYAGFDGVWSYTRPAPQSSDFTTERVLDGLAQPTAIDWAPDGRMFIAHQSGLVLVSDGGTPTTFIDLADEVNNNWNRGLLGIAVHPEFPTQPYVYLLYTYDPPGLPGADGTVDGKDGNGARTSRLLRVTADSSQGYNVALPGSGFVVLGNNSTLANVGDPADPGGDSGAVPACTLADGTPITDCLASEGPSHSIGWLEFGHDGNLWVTNGEGAPYITPDYRAARSQDLDSLGGKILRIDPDTGQGLDDNPYYDGNPASNRSRVWAYGLRNPFRFALHPTDNRIYVGDVGWYSWEELNYGEPEHNFGWPCYEGGAAGNVRHSLYKDYAGTAAVCQPLYDAEPDNGVTAPAFAYQNIAGAAIVAGDFYTGTRYPAQYQGKLFIADYDKRTISTLTFDQSGAATANLLLEDISALGGPVQLTLGPDGYLYYVALNPDPSGESEIRRVLYTSAPTVQISATPQYGPGPELTVAFESTLSSEAQADLLTYAWSFGDSGTSAETDPVHTYTANGTYTATLTIRTPQGKSSSDQIAIVVGNTPPVVTIDAPLTGTSYTISTTLAFSGSATDPETGAVDPSKLHWRAQWYFNEHLHPAFFSLDGADAGSFTVPGHNDNTSMFLCLTAEDDIPQLLDPTTCVELIPATVPYRFESAPADGYTVSYEGLDYTTPFTVDVMVNARRSIGAPATQASLPFAFWSDGGAATHEIVGQPTAQVLTATYGVYSLPTVEITATPQTGLAPLGVQFSSTLAADAAIGPVTYDWTFGDGATSLEANPSHTYVTTGTYQAALTVTTPLGQAGADPVTITVSGAPEHFYTYLPLIVRATTP